MKRMLALAGCLVTANLNPTPASLGPCKCDPKTLESVVSQTQNFWVVVDYGSQPGSCDAPTPPCKERAGCHLQFYVVYANNSSSPVYVVITPPGGGHVTARVDPNSAEGWECESAGSCGGAPFDLSVDNGDQLIMFCSACL